MMPEDYEATSVSDGGSYDAGARADSARMEPPAVESSASAAGYTRYARGGGARGGADPPDATTAVDAAHAHITNEYEDAINSVYGPDVYYSDTDGSHPSSISEVKYRRNNDVYYSDTDGSHASSVSGVMYRRNNDIYYSDTDGSHASSVSGVMYRRNSDGYYSEDYHTDGSHVSSVSGADHRIDCYLRTSQTDNANGNFHDDRNHTERGTQRPQHQPRFPSSAMNIGNHEPARNSCAALDVSGNYHYDNGADVRGNPRNDYGGHRYRDERDSDLEISGGHVHRVKFADEILGATSGYNSGGGGSDYPDDEDEGYSDGYYSASDDEAHRVDGYYYHDALDRRIHHYGYLRRKAASLAVVGLITMFHILSYLTDGRSGSGFFSSTPIGTRGARDDTGMPALGVIEGTHPGGWLPSDGNHHQQQQEEVGGEEDGEGNAQTLYQGGDDSKIGIPVMTLDNQQQTHGRLQQPVVYQQPEQQPGRPDQQSPQQQILVLTEGAATEPPQQTTGQPKSQPQGEKVILAAPPQREAATPIPSPQQEQHQLNTTSEKHASPAAPLSMDLPTEEEMKASREKAAAEASRIAAEEEARQKAVEEENLRVTATAQKDLHTKKKSDLIAAEELIKLDNLHKELADLMAQLNESQGQ